MFTSNTHKYASAFITITWPPFSQNIYFTVVNRAHNQNTLIKPLTRSRLTRFTLEPRVPVSVKRNWCAPSLFPPDLQNINITACTALDRFPPSCLFITLSFCCKEAAMRFANRLFGSEWRRLLSYTQGQSPETRIREYFYYIDHQGQVLHSEDG